MVENSNVSMNELIQRRDNEYNDYVPGAGVFNSMNDNTFNNSTLNNDSTFNNNIFNNTYVPDNNFSIISNNENIISNFSNGSLNCNNQTVNSIKNKYMLLLDENVDIEELINNDNKLKVISDRFNNIIKEIEEIFKDFKNLQIETTELSEKYEKSLVDLKLDIDKLGDFQLFLGSKNFKDEEKLIEPVIKNIEEICKNMLDNNKHDKIKDEYNKKLIVLKLYMHGFIKTINKGNTGTTCNICMTNNIDSYINPCGHTACSKCLEKLEDHDMKCFVCRKNVYDVKKLYF